MDFEERCVNEDPPLTSSTLLPLLKGVKSWRELANGLIRTHNDGAPTFWILDSTNLDALQRQHGSDEECLKAVIEKFLQGKGGRYKQPSWRAVYWSLYRTNEVQLASSIKSYAEPVQDPTLNVGNVTRAMEKITVDNRRQVWERVLVKGAVEEIYSSHSSEEEKLHSCADTYVTYKPGSSWEELVQKLYDYGEMAAAKEAKAFLQQKDPTLNVEDVTRAVEKVTVDNRRQMWEEVLGKGAVEEIYNSHSSEEEKLHSCANTYVTCKLHSSWERLVRMLYHCGEMAAAREGKVFLQQKDPTLNVGNVTRAMEKVTVDNQRQVWVEVLEEEAVEEIYSSHSSEEEKLHSCADTYVTCKPNSSWEEVVQKLYYSGEMAAAREAKAFLQQNDPTFTDSSVTDVMEKVTIDKRRQLWERVSRTEDVLLMRRQLLPPIPLDSSRRMINEIYNSHSSEKERTHACSDIYVNCRPNSSWEHLTSLLYDEDELTAADQARPFLPPRDLTLTTDRLTKLFQSVENPDRVGRHHRSIGELLGLPQSALEEIKKSYQSMAKRKEAYLDAYIHHHPCPSWKVISELLSACDLYEQAEKVKSTYVQGYRSHHIAISSAGTCLYNQR